jgi:hypothetical protein
MAVSVTAAQTALLVMDCQRSMDIPPILKST